MYPNPYELALHADIPCTLCISICSQTFTEHDLQTAEATSFTTPEATFTSTDSEHPGLSSGTSPVVYISVVVVILVLTVAMLVVIAVVYTKRKHRRMNTVNFKR
jgi:hypothetical protein